MNRLLLAIAIAAASTSVLGSNEVSPGGGGGVKTYATSAALPATARDGSAAITLDAHAFYIYNLGSLSWVVQTASTGVIGPGVSVNNELVLFNGTGGATVKRATGTGIAHVTSGVFSVATVNLASEVGGVLPVANVAGPAAAGTSGYLSSADWATFNAKQAALAAASSTVNGYLSSTDWSTFNGKQAAGSYVTTARTIGTTAPLTGGGDLSANRTIAIPAATGSGSGYLASGDWTTFNGKASAGANSNITSLSGITGSVTWHDGGVNTAELLAPNALTDSYQLFLPATGVGIATGASLVNTGGGQLGWSNAAPATTADITNQVTSITSKQAAILVCASNVTLSGETTCDGQTTFISLVLLVAQTDATQNGLWVTGPGGWTRGGYMPDNASSASGAVVSVAGGGGTTYDNTLWYSASDGSGPVHMRGVPIKAANAGLPLGTYTAAPANGLAVSGKTGIGTTSPSYQLTIDGGSAGPSSGMAVLEVHNTGGSTTGPTIRLDTDAGRNWRISSGSNTDAMPSGFQIIDASLPDVTRLGIDTNGNVGLGTTGPTTRLEVNGGVRLNTTATKPTCDATKEGTVWVAQGGAGVTDTLFVCLKAAADTYSWVTVTTGG